MQQQPRLPLWFLVVNWALIAAAFVLGAVLSGRRASNLPDAQRSALELVYHEAMASHIEPPPGDEWLERAIQHMVKELDPYSRYIPPRDAPAYDENNTGRYQGIGLQLLNVPDAVVFGFPFPGGPADRAGLMPGDVLVTVDGKAIDTPELRRRAAEFVRGPADTEVVLGIDRNGQRLERSVRRGAVQSPCVRWPHYVDPEAGIGYVHLSDFHPTAAEQLLEAIAQLRSVGDLRGLILDLRFNGGGSLDACLTIARTFLSEGIIATQRKRGGAIAETYRAKPELCKHPELPLAVLVNEASASASEVLSGALQDHGRATIVGTRTHGKAYVNTVYTWTNHDFRLKLTTGSYRTPNGRNIERSYRTDGQNANGERGGIPPDREVEVTDEQRRAIHASLARLAPPSKHLEAFAVVAEKYGLDVPAPPAADSDPQLAAALAAITETVEKAGAPR